MGDGALLPRLNANLKRAFDGVQTDTAKFGGASLEGFLGVEEETLALASFRFRVILQQQAPGTSSDLLPDDRDDREQVSLLNPALDRQPLLAAAQGKGHVQRVGA